MLAEAEEGLTPLYDGCKQNRDNWEKLQQEHDKLSKIRKTNLSDQMNLYPQRLNNSSSSSFVR